MYKIPLSKFMKDI